MLQGREKSGDVQSPVSYISSKDDEDIAKIVEQLKVTVKIFGCGGDGSNTINRCIREGIFGAELIAANTDAKHLLSIAANRKILLGRRTTRVSRPVQSRRWARNPQGNLREI